MGLDLSAELLGAAPPELLRLRGDSRRPPFAPRAFDCALSLFTSFGYHETRIEDAEQLAAWAELLAPGGRLFLDIPNPGPLRRSLVPMSHRREGELEITESRSLEAGGRRVIKRIRLAGPGGERHYVEAVNLYEPSELDPMLTAAGLEVDARWAGFHAEPFEASALRQVVRARRLL